MSPLSSSKLDFKIQSLEIHIQPCVYFVHVDPQENKTDTNNNNREKKRRKTNYLRSLTRTCL